MTQLAVCLCPRIGGRFRWCYSCSNTVYSFATDTHARPGWLEVGISRPACHQTSEREAYSDLVAEPKHMHIFFFFFFSPPQRLQRDVAISWVWLCVAHDAEMEQSYIDTFEACRLTSSDAGLLWGGLDERSCSRGLWESTSRLLITGYCNSIGRHFAHATCDLHLGLYGRSAVTIAIDQLSVMAAPRPAIEE